MLISAELATANIAMNGISLSIGKSGTPAETTLVRGVSPSPSSPIGTRATATIATST